MKETEVTEEELERRIQRKISFRQERSEIVNANRCLPRAKTGQEYRSPDVCIKSITNTYSPIRLPSQDSNEKHKVIKHGHHRNIHIRRNRDVTYDNRNDVVKFLMDHENITQFVILLPLIVTALYIVFIEKGTLVKFTQT